MALFHRFALAAALVASVACASAAQVAHPFSADFSIGGGRGSGGNRVYHHPVMLTADITVVPEHRGALIGAFALGTAVSADFGDQCLIDTGTNTGCALVFPSMIHLAVLGGYERSASWGAARGMVGPAVYGMPRGSGVAAQFQGDVAAGARHVQFLAAVRGAAIARFGGERLSLRTLSVGLRFQ